MPDWEKVGAFTHGGLSGLWGYDNMDDDAKTGVPKVPEPSDPPRRNPGREGEQMFAAQKKLAPGVFNQVEKYQPRITGLRESSMESIDAAMRNQHPYYYALLNELSDQAYSDLTRGGDLPPDERRRVEQDRRQGWNDRGLVRTDPALVDEVLGLAGARTNRRDRARSFAAGVTGMLGQERDQIYNMSSTDLSGLFTMFDPFNSYAANAYAQDYAGQLSGWQAQNKADQMNALLAYNYQAQQDARDAQERGQMVGMLTGDTMNLFGAKTAGANSYY